MITAHLDKLPDSVWLNGKHTTFLWRSCPWGYEVANVGDFVVALRFGDRCQMVFNLIRDLSAPPLKLRMEGVEQGGQPYIHPLYAQTGFMVLGPGVCVRSLDSVDFISMEIDGRIIAENYDPPQTWIGGSKGVDNGYHPFFRHADKNGWSSLHLRWAYGFLAYQCQRPRHLLETALGSPIGLAKIEASIPTLSGYSGLLERWPVGGLNAADAMHLDGTELYESWKRTGNVEFVWALCVLWAWVRRHSPLLLRKDTKYSGSPRVPAYAIRELTRLKEMSENVPMGVVADEIDDDLDYHTYKTSILLSDEPWYTTDNIAGNQKHQKPWMFAPLAQAYHDMNEPKMRDLILSRLENRWFSDAGIVYLENYDDPTKTQWSTQVPGTIDWWCRPLIEAGRTASPVFKWLEERVKGYGVNTLHAVSRLAPLIGW